MIDILSHKVLVREDKTLNAESSIQFFQNIEKAYPTMTTIHVFGDNARYLRNRKVRQYLETSKISLHFLPPYSPNLNPIERLWKWMKERIIYNVYYSEFEDLKSAIFGFFNTISQLDEASVFRQEFRKRVRDNFHVIGAPVDSS